MAITLPRPASVSRWAHAGAWFFIAFSLASVGWALARQWGDPSGTTYLYGDAVHCAWGLTYSGLFGVLVAMVQILAVGTAALLSTTSRAPMRRLGHRVLMGWSAVWWLNLAWLASLDLRVDSLGQAALMTALFGCTVYRAVRRPSRLAPAEPAAGNEDAFEIEVDPDVLAEESVIEISPPPADASVLERAKSSAKRIAAGPWKERAGAAAQRAKPVAKKAAAQTRRGLTALIARARPALKSAYDATRRGLVRLQSRLQNGWKTTSL